MKTTIEIPDALFQQAKVTSAQRGVTLKQLFIEGLEYAIDPQVSSESIQLTTEQQAFYQLDEEGIPVLKRQSAIRDDDYLESIDKLRNELGV